jgi:flagellar basal body-associated protein FliL
MAQADDTETQEKGGSSFVPTLIALVIVSLISAGVGVGIAWYKASVAQPPRSHAQAEEASEGGGTATEMEPTKKIVEIPSIMTNLSGEAAPWLRLDLSVVLPVAMPDQEVKLAELSDDFLSFLRTLTVEQISGGSNLQFLKQDLKEIARIRTSDAQVDILIRSLIIE